MRGNKAGLFPTTESGLSLPALGAKSIQLWTFRTHYQNYLKTMYYDIRRPAKQAHQGSEDSLQKQCALFLKKQLKAHSLPQCLFFHVPSEGVRKPQYRAKLKLMGFRAGIPDVILLVPNRYYSGLLIELKRAGGSPSKEQKEFLTEAGKRGFLCVILNTFEDFSGTVESYMSRIKPINK